MLPDEATARREAVRMAGALLKDEVDETWPDDGWTLEVTDADGRTHFTLTIQIT